MDIICITGATPGPVMVTISHEGAIRQMPMEVARHPVGGWLARHRGGAWGLRCHSVNTAVLLEAADTCVEMPMLLAAE